MFTHKGRNFYQINNDVAMSPIIDRQILCSLLKKEQQNMQYAFSRASNLTGNYTAEIPGYGLFSGVGQMSDTKMANNVLSEQQLD